MLILGDWLQLEAAVMVVRSNQRQPGFRCQLGFLAAVLVIARGRYRAELLFKVVIQIGLQRAFRQSLLELPEQSYNAEHGFGIR